ncbi:MAG TPA: prepilin-type cleavage/methylation domain-containing protein, partial [Usitatibacter sp.]|nr:prepilin-type cleavage/methylation domain-containing protein [Usitatibacter sp.]
ESFLFWQHVRLANLAAGPTSVGDATYRPTNAVGGNIGIASNTAATTQIAGMSGTYLVCSKGVLGKFALQLDVQMDDGQPCTGSMRAIPDVGNGTTNNVTPVKAAGAPAACTGANIDPDTTYTVCMTF